MQRRAFIKGLGVGMAMTMLPSMAFAKKGAEGNRLPDAAPALPILMFHKVVDTPQYPEDISTGQLTMLLDTLWQQGFCPVNMGDILTGRVDAVVPRGLKPLGITADDAHRSVVFSTATASHTEQRNARSFLDILQRSVVPYGREPRATLFLSGVGDDRYSSQPAGYFGSSRSLRAILDDLTHSPGLEMGYHTLRHVRMGGMGAEQVRAVMEEQIRDFTKQGVEPRIRRILAYPYGVRPTESGIAALKELGFLGAVLAFPGVNEARYTSLPACGYNGRLRTDPFLVPRVCIGACTYAAKGAPGPYAAIDPLEDFRKDVQEALPNLYTSAGAEA